jgi:chorismate mutase
MIAEPLSRLREQVNEELLKKAAERNSLVPIDRDPVPSIFQRQMDRYYENLGSGSRR